MEMRIVSLLLGAGATVSLLACSSAPHATAEKRVPAAEAVPSYPLNPKFEELLPNEAQNIAEIRAGILAIQEQAHSKDGRYLRGTHSKGTCVGGELEIYDVQSSAPGVATRLRKGLFSVPGRYVTDVRFANADGKINPDQQRDVRAVSFSVHAPTELSNPRGRMDFSMNDSSTFPINNAQVFADLMKNLAHGPVASTKEIGLWRERDALGAIVKGKLVQEKPGKTPYQKLRYWSTVPFALGDDEAVKYSLKPCASNRAEALGAEDPDGLRNELIRHVQNDHELGCFEFQVQLLESDRMTHGLARKKESPSWWVENAATEWNEKQAPFYPVGKLTLVANSVVDAAACESRWINVLANNSVIHHGLGSINRARTAAEAASASKRLERP